VKGWTPEGNEIELTPWQERAVAAVLAGETFTWGRGNGKSVVVETARRIQQEEAMKTARKSEAPEVTAREQEQRDGLRKFQRISLELSRTWPGETYLRFETMPGMAVMVGMAPLDLDDLRALLREEPA
jgi:hypothetical protein